MYAAIDLHGSMIASIVPTRGMIGLGKKICETTDREIESRVKTEPKQAWNEEQNRPLVTINRAK
jgi:hypothetical protein